MFHHMRDQHRLTDVIDQGDDTIFIPANVKYRGGSPRCGIPDYIRLAKQRLGVLKAMPVSFSRQFEPIIKSAGVLHALACRFIEHPKFFSADDVHDFTLCEDGWRKSRKIRFTFHSSCSFERQRRVSEVSRSDLLLNLVRWLADDG
jgi:hypothetical protein